jgi:outer membrane protein TolC
MSLFEGMRTINTLRLAQAGQKQATSSHESVKMDLLLSVKEMFYRLILAQERLNASGLYQRAVEDAVTNGHMDALERVEAEARQAESRARTSEAQHGVDLARLSFLKILNVELDTPFRVAGALEPKAVDVDIDRAVLWAIELRPELQSETYKAQMDAISVNLAAARRIPTVFLDSDYELTSVNFPLKHNNWDATIGVRIPFSYDYWSQLRQRRAEQRQGQLKRAELQDRVRLEVRQAYENLQYWQREWPLRESQYKRVEKLYTDAGRAGGVLSRVRAMGSVLDLKVAYLSAVTEHVLALARLERAVGRELRP